MGLGRQVGDAHGTGQAVGSVVAVPVRVLVQVLLVVAQLFSQAQLHLTFWFLAVAAQLSHLAMVRLVVTAVFQMDLADLHKLSLMVTLLHLVGVERVLVQEQVKEQLLRTLNYLEWENFSQAQNQEE